ncbi:hypothetical protein GUITHDRAFT_116625 [Guillardia theta CCMP2712]|uniref:Uncharacterized protein n=1 Tax=Guillardia theta (strain CCMP2712) TaxID=905079 RepID=L1IM73_GUITC|nr:hypothetical protein GUITHDRAFT_116625 [Guillardia theta CCMP2712]EKX37212.1 hypothetical protein GUITHDRAFT_116625 [Guillardia theta CCMP2712]|eukprot:XP_005824192.1 hypothetical protein GUITHDRAFT_116625 [Guillardia theta CCMP2712]
MDEIDEEDDDFEDDEEDDKEEEFGVSLLLAIERKGKDLPLLLELFFSAEGIRIVGAALGINPAGHVVNLHGTTNGLYSVYSNLRTEREADDDELETTTLKHFVDLNPPVQDAILNTVKKHLSKDVLAYLMEVIATLSTRMLLTIHGKSISQDQNKQFINFLRETSQWLEK